MNFYNGKYIYRFLTNLTINELKSFEKMWITLILPKPISRGFKTQV